VVVKDVDEPARQYTFKDIEEAAIDFGAGIRADLNVQKGDMIAVISLNDIDIPPVLFGAMSIGAILSPMNPAYTPPEIAKQLQNMEVKLVVAHFSIANVVAKVCASIGIPKSHILLLGSRIQSEDGIRHWKSLCRPTDKRDFQLPKISPKEDPALLLYSSGTTGVPKGVVHTHYSIISNLLQTMTADWGEIRPEGGMGRFENVPDPLPTGDKALLAIPFFHIFGLTYVVLTNLYAGIPVMVMPKYDFTKWCQTIQNEKITTVIMVPTIALRLIREQIPYDLSSIRMASIGGSTCPPEIKQALADRYGMPSRTGYGMTEAGPVMAAKRYYDWKNDLGSGDPLVPNVSCKLLPIPDETEEGPVSNEEVPRGELGEIYVKSPGVFKGYWKNPKATSETLSADGWLRTGDVGFIDEKGRIMITDRAKELIKHKGFQVAPAELEGILITHELIEDVAVVGAWSADILSEVPVAFVVPKGGFQALKPQDDVAIMRWLSTKVIKYKHLKGLKFVNAIPRNFNGKVIRRQVKDMATKEFSTKSSLPQVKL